MTKLADVLAPLVELVVKQVLMIVLPKLKEKDPVAYKTALVSLYGPIDVYVEELAEQTPSELDDAVVRALMGAIEDSAAADGIELPNLDDD